MASTQSDHTGIINPAHLAEARPVTAKALRRSWGEPPVRAWWLLAGGLLLITGWILIEQCFTIRTGRWRIDHWRKIPNARIEKIDITTRDTYRPPVEQLAIMESKLSYVTPDGQKHELAGKLKSQKRPVRPTDEIPILLNPENPQEWTDRVSADSLFQELMVPLLLVPLPILFALAAVWQRSRVLKLWRTGARREATVLDTRQSAAAPRSIIVRCTLSDKRDKRVLSVTIPRAAARFKPGDQLMLVTPIGEPSGAIAAMLYEE